MKDEIKMKELDIKELVEDFTQVITFKIILTIKNHYGSLESFKDSCRSKSNKELARYNKNFHIDSKILQSLTRGCDGKRHLDEVLANLNPEKLVYKHKFDWKYKSGKKFSKPSTFYIPFDELERLFALEDLEETLFNTKSGFYTKRQQRLIDKHILGLKKKKRKDYTKTDKFKKSVERRRRIKRIINKDPDKLSEKDVNYIADDLIEDINKED